MFCNWRIKSSKNFPRNHAVPGLFSENSSRDEVDWNQHPQICLIARFCEKTKIPKLGTKNSLFEYFWARILKNYYHIWNQHHRVSVIAKFREETKMTNFGTKSALFGYFWVRVLKKLLSYLKSAPSNWSICKISQKSKNA